MGTASNVALDVGALWVAPLGTTEPTGNATVQPGPLTGWRALGFTDNGSVLAPYKPTITPVFAEEEFYPIRYATDRIEGTIDFAMIEMIRSNLVLACNSGANAVNDATPFEPPTPGAELSVMIMWDSAVLGERWLFRQCIQVAAVAIQRRKSPNKSMIPASFALQKPPGLAPWKSFPATAGAII